MAGHDGGESRASSQGSKARPANRRVAQWVRDYVRLPGIPDEYIAQDGAPRPVWTRFFDAFAGLTPGFTGLYQVNLVVPSGVAPGAAEPVVLNEAGQSSVQVTIGVR